MGEKELRALPRATHPLSQLTLANAADQNVSRLSRGSPRGAGTGPRSADWRGHITLRPGGVSSNRTGSVSRGSSSQYKTEPAPTPPPDPGKLTTGLCLSFPPPGVKVQTKVPLTGCSLLTLRHPVHPEQHPPPCYRPLCNWLTALQSLPRAALPCWHLLLTATSTVPCF